ncbi:MAG: HEAT repeat domain-containing protein, partial [Planctomycetota bacterium]
DELVRSSAVRALRRAGAADRTSTFVELLDADPTPVRLEAAKALAFLPDDSALPRLLAIAEDAQEDQDVRIAAISALRHYRQTEVVERLVVLLDADPFSLAFQARTSLVFMFGADRGYKADRWLELAEGRVASERAS